jgi:hypothetical protein
MDNQFGRMGGAIAKPIVTGWVMGFTAFHPSYSP